MNFPQSIDGSKTNLEYASLWEIDANDIAKLKDPKNLTLERNGINNTRYLSAGGQGNAGGIELESNGNGLRLYAGGSAFRITENNNGLCWQTASGQFNNPPLSGDFTPLNIGANWFSTSGRLLVGDTKIDAFRELDMNGDKITGLANPTEIGDATNKFYVDNNYGSANIEGNGSQLNESGSVNILSVDSSTTGIKIITFDTDINQSKISLTIHDIGFVVLNKSSVNSIDVYTYNPAGILTNIGFNYIVYPF